jgi:hypothetical protein
MAPVILGIDALKRPAGNLVIQGSYSVPELAGKADS